MLLLVSLRFSFFLFVAIVCSFVSSFRPPQFFLFFEDAMLPFSSRISLFVCVCLVLSISLSLALSLPRMFPCVCALFEYPST